MTTRRRAPSAPQAVEQLQLLAVVAESRDRNLARRLRGIARHLTRLEVELEEARAALAVLADWADEQEGRS